MKIKRIHNEQADFVLKALRENDGYCPCKIEKTKDTLCMCKEFLEAGIGPCHCGLYFKEEI